MPTRATVRLSLLILLLACQAGEACERVSPKAHVLVATRAIELLPEPLGAVMRSQAAKIAAMARDIPEKAVAHSTMRGDTHFMLLDVAADDSSFPARRRAASAFPQSVRDAMKRCRDSGRTECGRLPWGTIETYAALVVAFRAKDDERVAVEAAALMHLATDAAMPFNTTAVPAALRDRNELGRGQNRITTRFQSEIIEQEYDRLSFEAQPWAGRLRSLSDPASAVFDTLLDAHADLNVLAEWASQSDRPHDDQGTPLAKDPAGDPPGMNRERIINMMESRLEAGVLLGAGLIHGAWLAAGKPLPHQIPALDDAVKDSASSVSDNGCGQPYCGSRDSTIYHIATCAHVRRIKPQNLIGFSSRDEAVQAGRESCRKCKPDLPNDPPH